MICPKAQRCEEEECKHKTGHGKDTGDPSSCSIESRGCPACIEVLMVCPNAYKCEDVKCDHYSPHDQDDCCILPDEAFKQCTNHCCPNCIHEHLVKEIFLTEKEMEV